MTDPDLYRQLLAERFPPEPRTPRPKKDRTPTRADVEAERRRVLYDATEPRR